MKFEFREADFTKSNVCFFEKRFNNIKNQILRTSF